MSLLLSGSFPRPLSAWSHALLYCSQRSGYHPSSKVLPQVLPILYTFSGALQIPKGNLLKQKRPIGVMKVVSNLNCGDKGICQNPLLASNFENTFAPVNCARVSSTRGNGCTSLCTHSLRGFRSTHIRMDPFCFGTTTIPAHHFVGCSTFDITPISSICFNSFCTFSQWEWDMSWEKIAWGCA